MAIKNTMSKSDFVASWPSSYKDNFSRSGLYALYDYLDSLSDDMGEDIEYDPIAFCCEYGEMALEELWEEYDAEGDIDINKDVDAFIKELEDRRVIIEDIGNGLVNLTMADDVGMIEEMPMEELPGDVITAEEM